MSADRPSNEIVACGLPDIDHSLLEHSLTLTPLQRMQANDDAANFADLLRQAMEQTNAES